MGTNSNTLLRRVFSVTAPDGEVLKRTSTGRVYTHAVISQYDEAQARAAAYDYKPSPTDNSNYRFYKHVSQQQPGVKVPVPGRDFSLTHTAHDIAQAAERVAGGWNAYVERLRAEAISRFEDRKAKGGFRFQAHGWSPSATRWQSWLGRWRRPRSRGRRLPPR